MGLVGGLPAHGSCSARNRAEWSELRIREAARPGALFFCFSVSLFVLRSTPYLLFVVGLVGDNGITIIK